MHNFPDLKSQKEIDREERLNRFKAWSYMVFMSSLIPILAVVITVFF